MTRSLYLVPILLFLGGLASVVFAQERILWRFDMDTPISGFEVAVGPDATIYGSDDTKLYALNPNGTIKWTTTTVRNNTPVAFLPDGTLITRLMNAIYALDPSDGSVVWTFSYPSNGLSSYIEVGPSIGPDGNIYAVTSINNGYGLGAFSLTPQGDLRWNDEGDPILGLINSHTGGPVYFTQDRLIFPFAVVTNGAHDVYGYDFNGNQTLIVDFTCLGIPRTDPLNRLLLASACGVEALEQDGNEIYWRVQFGAVNLAPAIGADATAYSGSYFGDVNAINPDGTIKWTSTTADFAQRLIAVRQDVERLVYSGAENYGIEEFVAGVDTESGSLLWQEFLRTVSGHHELMWTQRAATSADGSTVYFATRYTSNAVP
jgi:outer membrane protein assembly factor BamB